MLTTNILVAAKPGVTVIKVDTAVGKVLVHGDLTHYAILEHFWLVDSNATLR